MRFTDPKPVFYFSGTGTSLAVARRICAEILGFAPVPIAALMGEKEIWVDAEAVGFIFPLYYAGLPRIAEDFIKKLRFTRPCEAFAVIPCGRPRGVALSELARLLKKRGAKLSAGYYLKAVSNYLPLPHNDLNSRETIASRSGESSRRLDEIIGLLKRGDKTVEKVDTFLLRPLHPILLNISKRYDRLFSADANCTSCGTCGKVCPVNNIAIKDGKPVWRHDCQFCLACIHFCPQKAIQWNGVTGEKGRYHNPGVTVSDIAKQKEFDRGGMPDEVHRS